MAVYRWSDIKAKNLTPEQVARLEEQARRELLEMNEREANVNQLPFGKDCSTDPAKE